MSLRDAERYYFRLLLHHVPGATSFESVRTVHGNVCETYHQAAKKHGLLENDVEFDNDLALPAGVASPRQLLELFATILMFCELSEPSVLFDKYLMYLGEDFMHNRSLEAPDDTVTWSALSDIELALYRNGSTLKNFSSMPQDVQLPPSGTTDDISNSHHVLGEIMRT